MPRSMNMLNKPETVRLQHPGTRPGAIVFANKIHRKIISVKNKPFHTCPTTRSSPIFHTQHPALKNGSKCPDCSYVIKFHQLNTKKT